MRHKRMIMLLTVALVALAGLWTVTSAGLVEQRAVLQGEVVSNVAAGAHVEEGAELVRVATLAGSATAARATTRGVVKEILVRQGAMVKSGDVVARIAAD